MKMETYPIHIGETSMVFEFISEGIKKRVPKIIIYSETYLHNFYNLGFGDKNEITGDIDDKVITNNGDSEKVLATVAATLFIFMEKFPDAMVFAIGSTIARTRLYRIGIANNLKQIEKDFNLFGLMKEEWLPFKKDIAFDAFLITKKK